MTIIREIEQPDALADIFVAKPYVDLIRNKALSCSDVSDSMGKVGALFRADECPLLPLVNGLHKVGICYQITVDADNSNKIYSNWQVHEELANCNLKDRIVYVTNRFGTQDNKTSYLGHLVTTYAIKHLGAEAIVVNGNVRDSGKIRADNLPVWSTGVTPIGKLHSKPVADQHQGVFIPITHDTVDYTGCIFVCDDDGVVVVSKAWLHTKYLLDNLRKIAEREESWYEQLKQGKSTFEITCQAAPTKGV